MKVSTDDLRRQLRRTPRIGSAELCRRLNDINRSTLARLVAQMESEVLRRGGSRRTRYALRRALRGRLDTLPLYRIDHEGAGSLIASLDLSAPEGSALTFNTPFHWPLEDGEMVDGWFDGLPYPLLDMKPQGFLGRNFAHRYRQQIDLPENLNHWSDDDIVIALSLHGEDQSGDLILGDRAYQRYLDTRQDGERQWVRDADVAYRYPALSLEALSQGDVGSSAGGEFPKFTAVREIAGQPSSVIVKFSGADGSPAVQRWSDLLIAEHLALDLLPEALQIPAADSTIHQYAGRTFLEVIRFDRCGAHGRKALCSLGMLNDALLGKAGEPWPTLARGLHSRGWLHADDIDRIERLWWFGKLIANTDMHEGNLSFYPGLRLAPAYDMLPMLYAPLRGGEVPVKQFIPALPLPTALPAWRAAADAAQTYWIACAADHRISASFRKICAANADVIARTVNSAWLSA